MAYDSSKFEHDSSFDPSEFIIPASDAKGHSVGFHFRGPGATNRAIQQIVSCRRFPYITTSDLVRHAIVRHLDWLSEIAELTPQVKTTISMMRMENDYMRRRMEESEFEDHFQLVKKEVQEMLAKKGGKNEARRVVSRALSVIRQMPDDFARNEHLVRLEKEFDHLLYEPGKADKSVGKVNGSEDGEDAHDLAGRKQ